ncbi:MAG: hypothetical protein LBL65_00175 [Campylobacteraceae bacterium]|nr:hypothetical protein [Campylobacteraceae bacterium]
MIISLGCYASLAMTEDSMYVFSLKIYYKKIIKEWIAAPQAACNDENMKYISPSFVHCEERSDEAIQKIYQKR